MEKLTRKLCDSCKYRGQVEQKNCCNYIGVTGHSRIFENGAMAYNPRFCDKYEKGNRLMTEWLNIAPGHKDEYWDYKFVKIRKEKSTYAYKDREKRTN